MTKIAVHFPGPDWADLPEGGSVATVPDLGEVKIFRDPKSGWCVNINGQRASSAWRANLHDIKLTMSQRIRDWRYMNQFIKEG